MILIRNTSDRELVGSNLHLQFQVNQEFYGSAGIKGQAVREYRIPPGGRIEIPIQFSALDFFEVHGREVSRADFFKAPARDCQVRVWMGDVTSPKPMTESNLFVLSDWFPIPRP